jgi:hypothetical protein
MACSFKDYEEILIVDILVNYVSIIYTQVGFLMSFS